MKSGGWLVLGLAIGATACGAASHDEVAHDDARGAGYEPGGPPANLDSGTVEGAESDASNIAVASKDAGTSATADAGQVVHADSGAVHPDAGGSRDAGASPPPPACTNGQTQCLGHVTQSCVAGAWQSTTATTCCRDDARYVDYAAPGFAGYKLDTATHLAWHMYQQTSGHIVSFVCGDAKDATIAQYRAEIISDDIVNGAHVCGSVVSPSLFQLDARYGIGLADGNVDVHGNVRTSVSDYPQYYELCVTQAP